MENDDLEYFLEGFMPSKAEQEEIDHLMVLSSKIIKGLQKKQWSKSLFAQKMDQHPSVITKWLSGTHNFTSLTLLQIERVLEIQIFAKDEIVMESTVSVQSKAIAFDFKKYNFNPVFSLDMSVVIMSSESSNGDNTCLN